MIQSQRKVSCMKWLILIYCLILVDGWSLINTFSCNFSLSLSASKFTCCSSPIIYWTASILRNISFPLWISALTIESELGCKLICSVCDMFIFLSLSSDIFMFLTLSKGNIRKKNWQCNNNSHLRYHISNTSPPSCSWLQNST